MTDLAKLADVFFNGRPAKAAPRVSIEQLIKRGTSHVLVDGKVYRVVVTETEMVSAK